MTPVGTPSHCQFCDRSRFPDEKILFHGCPTNTSKKQVKRFGNVITSYDHTKRIPIWTMEYLTPERLRGTQWASKNGLEKDAELDERFRADFLDYQCYGYDRGHLVPTGNYRPCSRLMDQIDCYSLVAPQFRFGFNSNFEDLVPGTQKTDKQNWGHWTRLEQHMRDIITRNAVEAWICTGPLFVPDVDDNDDRFIRYQVIGRHNVAVPTHFFKCIFYVDIENGSRQLQAFVMKNERPVNRQFNEENYRGSLPEIEQIIGFSLFPGYKNTPAAPFTPLTPVMTPNSQKRANGRESDGDVVHGATRRRIDL